MWSLIGCTSRRSRSSSRQGYGCRYLTRSTCLLNKATRQSQFTKRLQNARIRHSPSAVKSAFDMVEYGEQPNYVSEIMKAQTAWHLANKKIVVATELEMLRRMREQEGVDGDEEEDEAEKLDEMTPGDDVMYDEEEHEEELQAHAKMLKEEAKESIDDMKENFEEIAERQGLRSAEHMELARRDMERVLDEVEQEYREKMKEGGESYEIPQLTKKQRERVGKAIGALEEDASSAAEVKKELLKMYNDGRQEVVSTEVWENFKEQGIFDRVQDSERLEKLMNEAKALFLRRENVEKSGASTNAIDTEMKELEGRIQALNEEIEKRREDIPNTFDELMQLVEEAKDPKHPQHHLRAEMIVAARKIGAIPSMNEDGEVPLSGFDAEVAESISRIDELREAYLSESADRRFIENSKLFQMCVKEENQKMLVRLVEMSDDEYKAWKERKGMSLVQESNEQQELSKAGISTVEYVLSLVSKHFLGIDNPVTVDEEEDVREVDGIMEDFEAFQEEIQKASTNPKVSIPDPLEPDGEATLKSKRTKASIPDPQEDEPDDEAMPESKRKLLRKLIQRFNETTDNDDIFLSELRGVQALQALDEDELEFADDDEDRLLKRMLTANIDMVKESRGANNGNWDLPDSHGDGDFLDDVVGVSPSKSGGRGAVGRNRVQYRVGSDVNRDDYSRRRTSDTYNSKSDSGGKSVRGSLNFLDANSSVKGIFNEDDGDKSDGLSHENRGAPDALNDDKAADWTVQQKKKFLEDKWKKLPDSFFKFDPEDMSGEEKKEVLDHVSKETYPWSEYQVPGHQVTFQTNASAAQLFSRNSDPSDELPHGILQADPQPFEDNPMYMFQARAKFGVLPAAYDSTGIDFSALRPNAQPRIEGSCRQFGRFDPDDDGLINLTDVHTIVEAFYTPRIADDITKRVRDDCLRGRIDVPRELFIQQLHTMKLSMKEIMRLEDSYDAECRRKSTHKLSLTQVSDMLACERVETKRPPIDHFVMVAFHAFVELLIDVETPHGAPFFNNRLRSLVQEPPKKEETRFDYDMRLLRKMMDVMHSPLKQMDTDDAKATLGQKDALYSQYHTMTDDDPEYGAGRAGEIYTRQQQHRDRLREVAALRDDEKPRDALFRKMMEYYQIFHLYKEDLWAERNHPPKNVPPTVKNMIKYMQLMQLKGMIRYERRKHETRQGMYFRPLPDDLDCSKVPEKHREYITYITKIFKTEVEKKVDFDWRTKQTAWAIYKHIIRSLYPKELGQPSKNEALSFFKHVNAKRPWTSINMR